MILPDWSHVHAIVNLTHPACRYRFTLAHQLYHYYFQGYPYVRERGARHPIHPGLGGYSKYSSELSANTFATELLVPHFMLRNHFLAARYVFDVPLVFNVSKAVADFAVSLQ